MRQTCSSAGCLLPRSVARTAPGELWQTRTLRNIGVAAVAKHCEGTIALMVSLPLLLAAPPKGPRGLVLWTPQWHVKHDETCLWRDTERRGCIKNG
jgi:hypothetical protein